MELPRNEFKKAIHAGQLQLGLWSMMPDAYAFEGLAGCGYDWMLIDTEHSPNDVLTVLPLLQTAAAYNVSPIVRPAINDPVLIKRYLDIGAQTLLIPFVQNAAEAQAAVDAMRYPPKGIRGVSAFSRASRFGRVKDYAGRAEEELCLLVQVETKAALDEIEAIAAVEGVDGIFIGPGDLSASLGYPGKLFEPAVISAIEDAIRRIKSAGKPAGILTQNTEFAKSCIDLGVVFAAIGSDMPILLNAATQRLTDFKAKLDD